MRIMRIIINRLKSCGFVNDATDCVTGKSTNNEVRHTVANQYSSELTEQRKVAVKLLTRGYCTVAEIAAHYGLARQTVAVWARGIDVAAARQAFVARAVKRVSPRVGVDDA